jgi:hypothetical protein
MIRVQGALKIKCALTECHREHIFTPNQANFELAKSEKEGDKTRNTYLWRHRFLCKCGRVIKFDYKVIEYPIGKLESEELYYGGAIETQRFKFEF